MQKESPNYDKSEALKALVGRLLAGIALLFCFPVGAFFVSVATDFVGILLGVVGYALGARRLGALAVVLCAAAMFLGLLIGQGALPGSYDAVLNGVKDALQWPVFEGEPGR